MLQQLDGEEDYQPTRHDHCQTHDQKPGSRCATLRAAGPPGPLGEQLLAVSGVLKDIGSV
jgi:hypothetical protein